MQTLILRNRTYGSRVDQLRLEYNPVSRSMSISAEENGIANHVILTEEAILEASEYLNACVKDIGENDGDG